MERADLIAKVTEMRDGYEHNQLAVYVAHLANEHGQAIGYDAASQLPIEELRRLHQEDDWGPMWELHDGEENEWHYHDEGAIEALNLVLELLAAEEEQ